MDSDGASDTDESIAGTDPSNGSDYFRVLTAVSDSLTWAAVDGKTYDIEFSTTLQKVRVGKQ